jgi:hypothetical protein
MGYSLSGAGTSAVWEIPTHKYPEAHFATYPEELSDAASSRARRAGCCGVRGTMEREVTGESRALVADRPKVGRRRESRRPVLNSVKTTGWRPSCQCTDTGAVPRPLGPDPVPCTFLDPFLAGTTALVPETRPRPSGSSCPEYCELQPGVPTNSHWRRYEQPFLTAVALDRCTREVQLLEAAEQFPGPPGGAGSRPGLLELGVTPPGWISTGSRTPHGVHRGGSSGTENADPTPLRVAE